ncbi:hypothetical protein EJ02DRAFT_423835 [Clathrospora elynae]|uniref:DUF6604 domain-containing protein n=1 Tax=Clathrospora elynae TaxID=706981 RepID=A0A6A5SLR7_9PLEO|nr:hypothetical protein EJ02DRAFT_423835 [Clathrospora elynae]
MALSFFSSNYRQYKKDTEYIAGWLAETAQKTGYNRSGDPVLPRPPPPPQQPATGVKEKSRKEARNPPAACTKGKAGIEVRTPPAASTNDSAATYRINVGDFIPMAEAMAK